jgi:acetyl esterase/lipase
MSLKPAWLKHTLSILFSGYYLVFAEAAEEKVRRIHSRISVEHMRTSWNKVEQNPYLDVFTRLLQPKMALRDIMYVDRPDYNAELPTMEVYRFYDGPLDTFADHDTIVLHIHGGGFVAMSPTCHSDALTAYAKQTGLPIISINYKKAPEYPFPWPIEECFDLYVAIVLSKGRVVGLSGERDIRIIIVGDSA